MSKIFDRLSRLLEKYLSLRNIVFLIVIWSIVIASGLIYVIVYKPPPMIGSGFVIRDPNSQTVSEVIVVSFSYGVGLLGLWLIYTSTKYRYRHSYLSILLVGGIVLAILSILMLSAIYNMKI